MVYPALLPLMRTPRLPVVDWTDAPADLNGFVRFAERRNLFSALVPSHFNCPLAVFTREFLFPAARWQNDFTQACHLLPTQQLFSLTGPNGFPSLWPEKGKRCTDRNVRFNLNTRRWTKPRSSDILNFILCVGQKVLFWRYSSALS